MIECWVRRDFRNYLTFSCENLRWCKGFLEYPTDELRAGVWKIAEEIYPGYSLKGLMLKLKLQHSGHLMRRADSLQKTLMLEKIEGGRRSRGQRVRWLEGIADAMDMNLSKLWEVGENREAWHAGFLIHPEGQKCFPWVCLLAFTVPSRYALIIAPFLAFVCVGGERGYTCLNDTGVSLNSWWWFSAHAREFHDKTLELVVWTVGW